MHTIGSIVFHKSILLRVITIRLFRLKKTQFKGKSDDFISFLREGVNRYIQCILEIQETIASII